MTSLPSAAPLSAEASSELAALRHVAELDEITARQRHLFARVRPPGSLREDEEYDVDLSVRSFVHILGGAVATRGHAQLVATVGRDGSWLWGAHNPSVSPSATDELDLSAVAGIDALRRAARFEIEESDASLLAQWIAVKAGFFTAYPARAGDATAWLALSPRIEAATQEETPHTQWCSFCGASRKYVRALVRGALGSICDACVRLAVDIHEETNPAAGSGPVDPQMPPCVMDGSRPPRLYGPYAAVGWATALEIAEMLSGR